MWKRNLIIVAIATVLMLPSACRREQHRDSVPTPTVAKPALIGVTSATPITSTPTVSAAPTETATAMVAPSATAVPTATLHPVMVAAPDQRIADVKGVLPASSGRRAWQIMPAGDPAAELAAGRAHLALVAGEDGVPAGQEPLVVAVPFTTEWEATTLAEAQEISANGHPTARVLPWRALTPPLKPLRIDGFHPLDSRYPLQRAWSLVAQPGYEEAAEELGRLLEARTVAGETVRLAAVGDVMLDRALGAAIGNGNVDYPFANVAGLLESADVAAANVESALGDVGEPANKSYTFRAPPAAALSLARAGFDVVTLANNHALDYGPAALKQAISLLKAEGVKTVGAGENAAAARTPALINQKGVTLAFLGYVDVPVEGRPPYFDTQSWTATETTPGLAWAHPEQIRADVAAARQQADHVIVLLHSGYEYVPAPSEQQKAAAHAAINAGASLVIGHHAHILQGVEFLESGVIVYGLGNFAFTINGAPETALLNVWLDRASVRQIEFVPAIVGNAGQPRLAHGEEADAIRRNVYYLTTLLNPAGP